jgi:ERF superfamily
MTDTVVTVDRDGTIHDIDGPLDDEAQRPHALGALAAALAKAQSAFPTIPRDKTVTVQTKTGGSYKFSYAPLDTILAAVRAPLAANDLAVTQLLDGDGLVTMLLHKSGAALTGRVRLPRSDNDNVQALGSAITYLRRYSIQAVLGIAAEEDDDGNRASGNEATARPKKGEVEELVGNKQAAGVIRAGGAATTKLEVRTEPEGPAFGFYLEGPKGAQENMPQVIVKAPLAAAVMAQEKGDPKNLKGHWCRVNGKVYVVRNAEGGIFERMYAETFETKEYKIPPDPEPAGVTGQAPDDAQSQVGSPSGLFDAEAEKELDGALG